MRLLPRFILFATLAIACFALSARDARAQSCTPSTASVTTVIGPVTRNSDGTLPLPDHPGNPAVPVNAINHSDCANDEILQMTVGITAQTSNAIQVWAGSSDCGSLASRTTATQTCWPVMQPVPATVNPTTLNIRARDIVAFINAGTGSKPNTYAQQPASVCDTAQTSDAAAPISLYVFITDTQGNVCGKEITYGVSVDMLAGSLSGSPTASAGDGQIFVNIPSTSDPDIKGYKVYVDPPPSGPGATVDAASPPLCDAAVAVPVDATVADVGAGDAEAGAGEAGGAEASSSSSGSGSSSGGSGCVAAPQVDAGAAPLVGGNAACTSTVLVSGGGTTTTNEAGVSTTTGGTPSNVPSNYLGTSVGLSTTATVDHLINNWTYTVAVAATDAVGNIGPLTVVSSCGVNTTPNPVSDFWTAYHNDDKGVGGGFCQTEGVGAPAGSAALGVMMLSGLVGMLRRRRRS